MCGIHGIVSRSLSKEEMIRRLDEMGALQRHRGPDDKREDVFTLHGTRIGFGLMRLSILDLETGMQPIICRGDGSAIICNGQIYNYIELKPGVESEPFVSKGDIEVALHLYRVRGLDFLNRLNGMYAGAIYDPKHGRLLLFRDRFGIKPVYYTEWEDNFLFSSEIKPLLRGSRRPAELNGSRLATFFTYRYLPGEETMFSGVKRLPPGSYLEYDLKSHQYEIKRYWEYRLDREAADLSLDEASERFMELLEDAVHIRLRSDVEVGCLLSGGIDSSAVSSLSVNMKPELKLFTIAFKEKRYNELPDIRNFLKAKKDRFGSAKHYSRICGIQSLKQLPGIVRSVEEPISLGTLLPTDQVCEMAGRYLKVVLTGEGADEIFAGYRKFLIESAAHEYDRLPPERRGDLDQAFPELAAYLKIRADDPARRYIQSESLFTPYELQRLLGRDIPEDMFPRDALPSLSGDEHPLNAAIALESRARLPDYVILRLDKLSMRHSLETRTPFLDYRLAEFAAGLPVGLKVDLREKRGKAVCAYAFAKYSVLDRRTAFREKLPFTIPLAEWLAKPSRLPDFLQEILFGNMIREQGILNHEVIRRHVDRISAEGVGPQTLVSDADRVFAAIIFTLWYDIFIKQ